MKVVLTKDVKDTGRAHSVVEVSDGHAINFLMPRGLAVAANAHNLKQTEGRQKQVVEKRAVSDKLVAERLAALAAETTTITKKANEQGHLYDGVDVHDIAAATQLPVEAIKLEKPIKEVGTFDIPIAVGENFGAISIVIAAEL